MAKNPRDIFGEYDPPLPTVNPNPTKADKEKIQKLIEKHKKLAEERQAAE